MVAGDFQRNFQPNNRRRGDRSLQFKSSQKEGALVLELSGAVDGMMALEPVLETARKTSASYVILVLDGVDYLNSEGFGALVRFSDAMSAAHKGLCVVGLQQKVRVVFNTLGMGSMVNIFSTLSEALASIRIPTN